MLELFQTLWQLVLTLGQLLVELLQLGFNHFLVLFFLAWCLWGINWRKTWPILARGGWAPVVLGLFMSALAWSRLAPGDCNCLRIMTVPNFCWQLGYVSMLAASALFCGWLQDYFGWQVPELQLDPPAPEHHEHGHHH